VFLRKPVDIQRPHGFTFRKIIRCFDPTRASAAAVKFCCHLAPYELVSGGKLSRCLGAGGQVTRLQGYSETRRTEMCICTMARMNFLQKCRAAQWIAQYGRLSADNCAHARGLPWRALYRRVCRLQRIMALQKKKKQRNKLRGH
jgi:hypothetical protein